MELIIILIGMLGLSGGAGWLMIRNFYYPRFRRKNSRLSKLI